MTGLLAPFASTGCLQKQAPRAAPVRDVVLKAVRARRPRRLRLARPAARKAALVRVVVARAWQASACSLYDMRAHSCSALACLGLLSTASVGHTLRGLCTAAICLFAGIAATEQVDGPSRRTLQAAVDVFGCNARRADEVNVEHARFRAQQRVGLRDQRVWPLQLQIPAASVSRVCSLFRLERRRKPYGERNSKTGSVSKVEQGCTGSRFIRPRISAPLSISMVVAPT